MWPPSLRFSGGCASDRPRREHQAALFFLCVQVALVAHLLFLRIMNSDACTSEQRSCQDGLGRSSQSACRSWAISPRLQRFELWLLLRGLVRQLVLPRPGAGFTGFVSNPLSAHVRLEPVLG